MKLSHASAEQRREKRDEFLAGQLFVVDLIGKTLGPKTHGIVLNISKGGMAVQTVRPLALGSVAEISVSFPRAPLSIGPGVVAWQKQGGLVGIRFLTAPRSPLPELRQSGLRDLSAQRFDSALPLFYCRNKASTNAFETTLHLFACCAMTLSGANGVAIALGNSNGMECRASVGSAPEVRTQLRPDSGISGHSMRTSAVIICNDAFSDSRVNIAAARQMDVRSIAIVPITVTENVVGLLEVFSRDTNHFDDSNVQQLLPFVNALAEAIKEETANNTGDEPDERAPAAVGAIEAVETAAPVETQIAALSQFNRYQGIVIAGGVAAVLLVFIVAMALLSSRYRTKSPEISNFAISTHKAQSPSAGATQQGAASTAKPEISFNPQLIEQKVGATFGVNVVMKGAENISSAPMQIHYDPEKLQVITVSSGGLLNRDGQAATMVHRVDSSVGRIDISIARPLSVPGISGDGVVFTLMFVSKASGRSTLRIDQTGLRDTSTKAVPVSTSEAIVTISKSTTPAGNDTDQDTAEVRTPPPPSTAEPSRSTMPEESATRTEANRGAEAIPIPPLASLVVDGAPGTQVFVDAQAPATLGTDGSVRIQNLSPGLHHLRFTLQGFRERDESVDVLPGKTLAISGILLLPLEPSLMSTGKAPVAIAPAIALVPRSPVVPSFVLDRTFKGHTNWVTAVAFSADGKRLVSGSWDQSVKVWDVATGQMLNTIASKVTGIQASAVSHNGQLIAAEDASDNIRIWSATTGEEIRTLKGDRSPLDASWVFSIAFSPDDSLLAAALDSKTVRLWDVNSGRAVRDFTGNSRGFIYAAFSPDGRWLATGGDTKTIEILDVATGKVSKTLKGHKKDVYAVAFSPDGRWLASAGRDKTVKVWELATGREVHTLTGHENSVTGLAFSPNGRWLATSSWDKTVRVWDVESGSEVQTLTGHTHQIYSLAFDSRGGWLATGSADGTIKLWRLRKEIDISVLGEEKSTSATASVAPAGRPQ